MVVRSSVPCTTDRRSSARSRSGRPKLRIRDQRPMYIDGAYCACSPPIRSSPRGIGSRVRSSRSCRASSARFSSRCDSVRSGIGADILADVLATLAAFVGVSVVVICTPGQDTALTIRNTLAGGRRSGIETAAGVAVGQTVWTLAASAGIVALLRASEPMFHALKLVGAAYLV